MCPELADDFGAALDQAAAQLTQAHDLAALAQSKSQLPPTPSAVSVLTDEVTVLAGSLAQRCVALSAPVKPSMSADSFDLDAGPQPPVLGEAWAVAVSAAAGEVVLANAASTLGATWAAAISNAAAEVAPKPPGEGPAGLAAVPTGAFAHAGPAKGQPLVSWTPVQLTPGYQHIVTVEAAVVPHETLLTSFPNATAGSNYRTFEEQQVLYASSGDPHYDPAQSVGPYSCNGGCSGAAAPGTSNHESGLAIDYIVPAADKPAFIALALELGAVEVLDEGHMHIAFPAG